MDHAPQPNRPLDLMSPRERVGEFKKRFGGLVEKRSKIFPGSRQSDAERPALWNEALDIMTPLCGEIEGAAKKPSFLKKVLPPEEIRTAKQTFADCLRIIQEEVTTEFKHLDNVQVLDNNGSINFNLDSRGEVQQVSLKNTDGSFAGIATLVDPDNVNSDSLDRLRTILTRISNYQDRNETHRLWHRYQENVNEELKSTLSKNLAEHPTPLYTTMIDAKKQFQGFLKGLFERRKGGRKDPFLANLVQKFVRSKGVVGGTMLDIAAGAGWESLAGLQAGAKSAVMLDISHFSQAEAQKRQKEVPIDSTIKAVTTDVTKDAFPAVEGGYQGAICLNVLELLSVQERQHIISEAWRNLAPGQHFLVVAEDIPTTASLADPREELGDTWHVLPKENTQTFPWGTEEERRLTSDILGLTHEVAVNIKTTAQLAELVQAKIDKGELKGCSGITWEGCQSEEMKAQLSNAGFVIDHCETGIINPTSRYTDGPGGRSNQFFIIAQKPAAG